MTNTNYDIAKSFVSGKPAKNKSMSTDGKTLYSYRTAIAKRMKNGEIVVNTSKYSRTTSSKHSPALRQALRDVPQKDISYTGDKDFGYDYQDFDDDDFTQDNDDIYKKSLRKKLR